MCHPSRSRQSVPGTQGPGSGKQRGPSQCRGPPRPIDRTAGAAPQLPPAAGTRRRSTRTRSAGQGRGFAQKDPLRGEASRQDHLDGPLLWLHLGKPDRYRASCRQLLASNVYPKPREGQCCGLAMCSGFQGRRGHRGGDPASRIGPGVLLHRSEALGFYHIRRGSLPSGPVR